jgi:hypothetical protein
MILRVNRLQQLSGNRIEEGFGMKHERRRNPMKNRSCFLLTGCIAAVMI